MECLPAAASDANPAASSVNRVADQWETKVPQMHSNLMRATSLQLTEHQRDRFAVT